jgi:hypothetical protein
MPNGHKGNHNSKIGERRIALTSVAITQGD